MAKIRNFDSFGGCIPTFLPPLPRAKFHVYWGKKPIFGLLSKNNTGMAVLCPGLPVIIYKFIRHYDKVTTRAP